MNFFESVQGEPPDSILGLNQSFAADERASKVNLGAGVYKTAELKPLILKAVKKSESWLLERESSKDYLPIDGLPAFVSLTKELVFGTPSDFIYGAQTAGGTGALRIGATFLRDIGLKTVYISSPTWDNHHRIFQHAGVQVKTYPYYNAEKRGFDAPAMLKALDEMEKGAIVLLQGCCHNPTGFDPTFEEWQEIFQKIKARELFPFIDFAYQGFGDGLVEDARPIRTALEMGLEFLVACSYAKNFGLYAERCGALFVVCKSAEEAKKVGSKIKVIIRGFYSNPPCHGACIVAHILGDPQLRREWEEELSTMRGRITVMRQQLARKLGLDFLAAQKGMFSYTGLTAEQVARLATEDAIYMPRDGRVNVAGLSAANLKYVTDAILKVTK